MSGEAREQFTAYIPDGDINRFASELPTKIKNDFTTTMQLLRDPAFQDLLLNYKRPQRTFVRANGHPDVVSSGVMIPFGSDFLKPEDYLDQFSRFVKENPDHVEAIRILLDKPSDWKTSALNELRQALQRHRFPWEELEKAHRKVYRKPLVDIISMVKHAARATEPILTAQERVDNALSTITAGKSFTDEQQKWLGLIREHLITNLTIDETDLETQPVFERAGGLGKAKRVFPDNLPILLAQLNAAVAA
jgi:type I restriction enzyme R subunit